MSKQVVSRQITLGEAKDSLRSKLREGARCPCCTQFAKTYARRIYSTIAYELILLYKMETFEFVHMTEILKERKHTRTGGGDFAKLLYWGLVEELPNEEDPEKRTSGFWRITDKGRQFVEMKITIPEKVLIYDSRCMGFEGEQIYITKCLGDRFDYRELMDGF